MQNERGAAHQDYAWWTVGSWGADSFLSEDQKRGFASVSYMKCPTRRTGASQATTEHAGAQWKIRGPRGDYALVTANDQSRSGQPWGWVMSHRSNASEGVEPAGQVGTFRSANYANNVSPNAREWSVRDTFSRFSDGLSNSLFIGEKQLFIGNADNRAWMDHDPPTSGGDEGWEMADGTWLTPTGNRSYSIFRPTLFRGSVAEIDTLDAGWQLVTIQPRTSHLTMRGSPPMNFGSWHTGSTNFVLGDGSVRGVSDSINGRLFARLGVPNDGGTVAIP